MDFGNYIGMLMIDLQKAFDTVDHYILEKKLKAIGSKAFKLNGIKSWNKLPLKKKKLNSLSTFKQAVRLT